MPKIYVQKWEDNMPNANNVLFFNSQKLDIQWNKNINFLELNFNDITEPQDNLIMPNKNHIKTMIRFFEQWNKKSPLVICCQMGVSRSTAAAIIACMVVKPDASPKNIADLIRKKSKAASPNKKIIELADQELKLGGKLSQAVEGIGRGNGPPKPFSINVEDEI